MMDYDSYLEELDLASRRMGVIKLFDKNGRLCDSGPYFGGFANLRFGTSKKCQKLGRLVLVTSDGKETLLWTSGPSVFRGEIKFRHPPIVARGVRSMEEMRSL